MSGQWYITIYDENKLFKGIIDEIIISHNINCKDYEEDWRERVKVAESLFDEVKSEMIQVWNEKIDDEELLETIEHRIIKMTGCWCPYD